MEKVYISMNLKRKVTLTSIKMNKVYFEEAFTGMVYSVLLSTEENGKLKKYASLINLDSSLDRAQCIQLRIVSVFYSETFGSSFNPTLVYGLSRQTVNIIKIRDEPKALENSIFNGDTILVEFENFQDEIKEGEIVFFFEKTVKLMAKVEIVYY